MVKLSENIAYDNIFHYDERHVSQQTLFWFYKLTTSFPDEDHLFNKIIKYCPILLLLNEFIFKRIITQCDVSMLNLYLFINYQPRLTLERWG